MQNRQGAAPLTKEGGWGGRVNRGGWTMEDVDASRMIYMQMDELGLSAGGGGQIC